MKNRSGHNKLHLGCGTVRLQDMWNVDIKPGPTVDECCDIRYLPYPDNSSEYMYASHVLEHISYLETPDVLKEWYRVLCAGGTIIIHVPDFNKIVDDYLNCHVEQTAPIGNNLSDRVMAYLRHKLLIKHRRIVPGFVGVIVGKPDTYEDLHKAVFNYRSLKELLIQAGFVCVKMLKPGDSYSVNDASKANVSMGVICRKP